MKEGDTMFDFAGVPYPVTFANYQFNSWIPVEVKSTLITGWVRDYAEVDENAVFMPVSVLVKDSHIGVRCGSKLLVYDRNGLFQFLEPLSEAASVVFGREAMAFVQPSLKLIYQDYARNPKGAGRTVPGLEEWTYAMLLKPEATEVIAATQFTGGPQMEPRRFEACAVVLSNGARRWFFGIDGSVESVLLTNDGQRMILLHSGVAELRSVKGGDIISTFQTNVSPCLAASLDPTDQLLLISKSTQDVVPTIELRAFDSGGKEQWTYSGVTLQAHQPPACGPNGRVYLVNGESLECINEGTLLWSCPLKSAQKSWVTIAKDGTAVVLNGIWLYVINAQGKQVAEKLLSTDEEESFDAPPAIGTQGQIFVASGKRLYCFR
jgi:hypothetical protein